jgi:hypothetical protein
MTLLTVSRLTVSLLTVTLLTVTLQPGTGRALSTFFSHLRGLHSRDVSTLPSRCN